MKNFKTVLQELFEEAIADEKERLLCKNEEDYFQGYDEDYVDVGVGSVCVRRDAIYDEKKLEDDAKENVVEELFSVIERVYKYENRRRKEKRMGGKGYCYKSIKGA